jgi:hypothetical protein
MGMFLVITPDQNCLTLQEVNLTFIENKEAALLHQVEKGLESFK